MPPLMLVLHTTMLNLIGGQLLINAAPNGGTEITIQIL